MYKVSITVLLSMLLTACGGGSKPQVQNNSVSTPNTNTAVISSQEFAYETQSSIDISVSLVLNSESKQKQILFYETQKIDSSPVGDQLIFDGLLMDGVTDVEGKYSTKVTLGNHIDSIWVVIPALSYENQISIIDNMITVNITQGS